MKKKISIALCFIIVITSVLSFSFDAFARTSGKVGNLEWDINEKTGVLTIAGNGYGGNFDYGINTPWYIHRDLITSIVVEEGVQAIGDNWFSGERKVKSVSLPNSLVKIGKNCFYQCNSLEGIIIPNNCTEIYDQVFYNCYEMKWAILPRDNRLHTIPYRMFYNCSNLQQLYIGEGFEKAEVEVFYGCNSLKTIICKNSNLDMTNIPTIADFISSSINGAAGGLDYVFDINTLLLTVFGDGDMGDPVPWKSYCYLIKSINLDGITTFEGYPIAGEAFLNCVNIQRKIVINSNVDSVIQDAFYNSGVKEITFLCPVIYDDFVYPIFNVDDNIIIYGYRNSGLYEYVKKCSSNWKFYCLNNEHQYENDKCIYCDKTKNDDFCYISSDNQHELTYHYKTAGNLYYRCKSCDNAEIKENIKSVMMDLGKALSSNKLDYDGRFDIDKNGYVNAKDYAILRDMRRGKKTDYDVMLSNPNADANAKILYQYIKGVYGNGIITGQQESTWVGGSEYEMNYIYSNTGKYPAIRGLDFMNDDFRGCVNRAKEWHNRGGIVTICWHCSASFDKSYDQCKADSFPANWEKILQDGTNENKKFKAGMKKAGDALKQLQDAGVTVLWRPFHEFDGAWFWWGKGGAEKFKELWIMMYNYYTYELGLTNLIWVLGYCHNGTDYGTNLADWYPGDQYCDIVGADSYEVDQNGGEQRLFTPVYNVVDGIKPLALHETGQIPTVADFKGTKWCFFMTWHTEWLIDKNSTNVMRELYNSDWAITLDELPKLTK